MTDTNQASYWQDVAERALAKQHEYEAQLAAAESVVSHESADRFASNERCDRLAAALAVSEAQLAKAVEALEWYAGDGSTYDGIDVGQRARKTLEALRSPAPADGRGDKDSSNDWYSAAQLEEIERANAGLMLAPLEPTEDMETAGRAAIDEGIRQGYSGPYVEHDTAEKTYRAMLAAAPPVADATPKTDLPSEARADGVKDADRRFTELRVAYKRGAAWALEHPGLNSSWVEKAAYDYADKATSSALTAPDHADVASQGGDK